ncbi:MAG: methionine--tRNA ligase, partial [Clostridium sp.]|nr:methionine--tRNA ligase [Clostridium sp.]
CVQYIGNLSNLIEPFMPFTAEKIRSFLGIKEATWMPIEVKNGKINNIEILFERIDKSIADEEIARLKEEKF